MKLSSKNISSIFIVFYAITGISKFIFPGKTNNVIFSMIFTYALFLIILSHGLAKYLSFLKERNKSLYIYILYTCFTIILAAVIANTYEQWNYLFCVCIPLLLLPFYSILAADINNVIALIKGIIYFLLPCSILHLLHDFTPEIKNFTGYVSLIYLLILFFPYFQRKIKIVMGAVFVCSFFYDPSDRTNILMLAIVLLITMGYYIRKKISLRFYKGIRILLLFFPFVAAVVSISYISFFSISEKTDFFKSKNEEGEIFISDVDTRTAIYSEVFSSLSENPLYIVFGKSAIGTYESITLAEAGGLVIYDRMSCEVGILEVLIRGGIVYFLIYLFITVKASSVLIFKSENYLSKALGFYIICYWIMMFIEFQPQFNSWTMSFFIAIGLSMNKCFRNLSDYQLKNWLRNSNL